MAILPCHPPLCGLSAESLPLGQIWAQEGSLPALLVSTFLAATQGCKLMLKAFTGLCVTLLALSVAISLLFFLDLHCGFTTVVP